MIINKKDAYDDKITFVTTCFYESEPFIVIINNNQIIILNKEYEKIKKSGNNNMIPINSFSISSDLLIYTDDIQLHLYDFPSLT